MATIQHSHRVTVGVDTHLDIHVAHAKDAMGRRLGTCSIPATPAGYAELLDWARAFGEVQAWGVEGTDSYGAGLARLLRDQGQVVVEVNRPDRSTRCLRVARVTAMKARTQAINAIKALLVTAPAELREQLRGLPAARLVTTAARLEPDSLASPTAAAKLALCTLARRYQALSSEITTLSSELERLTAAAAPLVAAGDNPDRLHSEASFSMLCGSGTLGRWLRDRRNPHAGLSVEDSYAGPARTRLRRRPGERIKYSNLGAGLLGHALARAAGRPYEQLVRERICRPLGMPDTVITPAGEQTARLATGHTRRGRPAPPFELPALAGPGALHSTATDMVCLLEANLDPARTPLADQLERARRPASPVARRIQVGLGWLIAHPPGAAGSVLWHNGGTSGFRSFIAVVRGAGTAVVVLSNSARSVDRLGWGCSRR
jgi:hypothetical protein